MEVLFAVAILAIGLIFLACQFPVGMFSARDNVYQTRKVLETHNSQVMMEVQLSLVDPSRILDNRGDQINWRLDKWHPKNVHADKDITRIHFLPKPNVYVNPPTGAPTLVLDDPEGLEGKMAYLLTEIDIDLGPPYNYKFKKDPSEPEPLFWSELIPVTDPLPLPATTVVFLGDIGHIMSPPVDETDPKVQKVIRRMELYSDPYDPLDPDHRLDYLHPAIFEVSLESNYSWAAFYKEGEEQYYIFALRNPRKEVRYAVQAWDSFYYLNPPNFWNGPASRPRPRDCYGEIYDVEIQPVGDWPEPPAPDDAEFDRVFPVPWRVCLGPFSRRYIWAGKNSSGDYNYRDSDWNEAPQVFEIPEAVADILRPGSILIDADPADNDHDGIGRLTSTGSGQLYEVSEVFVENDETYWVRLRTRLHDDLHYFWVFPPPVLRDEDGNFMGYDDWQPVVSVTKKVIEID